MKLSIFKYNYQIFEPNYANFNVTELKSGGHIMNIEVLEENLMFWVTVTIHFKNSKNEYTEFMNKTINVCKMLNNRRYEPLLSILYDALSARAMLPKRCPMKKVCVFDFDLIVIFYNSFVYLETIHNYI